MYMQEPMQASDTNDTIDRQTTRTVQRSDPTVGKGTPRMCVAPAYACVHGKGGFTLRRSENIMCDGWLRSDQNCPSSAFYYLIQTPDRWIHQKKVANRKLEAHIASRMDPGKIENVLQSGENPRKKSFWSDRPKTKMFSPPGAIFVPSWPC